AAPRSEIYALSLHDALPIWGRVRFRWPSSSSASCGARRSDEAITQCVIPPGARPAPAAALPMALIGGDGGFSIGAAGKPPALHLDRKSTRLNSSHDQISYAV